MATEPGTVMIRLKDLATSGDITYSDGYRTRQDQLAPTGLPILRVAEVLDGAISPSEGDCVASSFRVKMGRKISVAGDVLITTKGTVGRVAQVPSWLPEHVYSPQLCFIRVLNPEKIDARWLYYFARSPEFQRQVLKFSGQTDMAPYLSLNDLGEIVVPVPSIDEQRRIATVLGAIDGLVDTNRTLIDALVELVGAAFLHRFGERELSIPVGKLARVVDCLHSKKPERRSAGQLCLQLNNILDNGLLSLDSQYLVSDADYALWTRNLETTAWDCVITNVGRVGAVARIPAGVKSALGRNMTAVRPFDASRDGAFLVAALLSPPVRREIALKTDTGTILDALNVKNIAGLRLPTSTEDERQTFQNLAGALLTQADELLVENRLLRHTRDEILPYLVSGHAVVRRVAA